jgi:hypothetical protein
MTRFISTSILISLFALAAEFFPSTAEAQPDPLPAARPNLYEAVTALREVLWLAAAADISGASQVPGLCNPFFLPEDWTRMPLEFRDKWVPPGGDLLPGKGEESPIRDLREYFFRWLLPFMKPDYLPVDLPDRVRYLKLADGLEGLECNYFYLEYATSESSFQVKGWWRGIGVLIKPPRMTIPAEVQRELSQAESKDDPSVKYYETPPAPVVSFLEQLWMRYLKPPLPKPKGDKQAETLEVAQAQRGLRLHGQLQGFPGGSSEADVYLWTNGRLVEIMLYPSLYAFPWGSPMVIALTPLPSVPAVAPLNPELVLYEESGLFQNEKRKWVNKAESAKQTLLRVIYRQQNDSFWNWNEEYWATLPVTTEQWRVCEYYALVAPLLTYVREQMLYSEEEQRHFREPQARRTVLAYLESRNNDYAGILAQFNRIQCSPETHQIHEEVKALLTNVQSVWDLATRHWQQVQAERPQLDPDQYGEECAQLREKLQERGIGWTSFRDRFPPLMEALNHQLVQQGVRPEVEP